MVELPSRPRPSDADAWFESFFDGRVIGFTDSARTGFDEQHARVLAVHALQEAVLPGNPPGSPRPFSPDDEWHVVRVTVRAESASLAGGPLGANTAHLRPVRDLIESLIAHLSC